MLTTQYTRSISRCKSRSLTSPGAFARRVNEGFQPCRRTLVVEKLTTLGTVDILIVDTEVFRRLINLSLGVEVSEKRPVGQWRTGAVCLALAAERSEAAGVNADL